MGVLILAAVFALTGSGSIVDIPVDTSPDNEGTDYLLQYDDGTAHWILSGVACFGTWFDIEDFIPATSVFHCDYSEWWFYHNANYPWDTDMIVLEIWSGDVTMPVTLLQSDDVTALHYSPTQVYYSSSVYTDGQFWANANTSVYSASGVPSMLYDETNNFTGEPRSFAGGGPVMFGGVAVDALVRVDGYVMSLESESWAAIKGLFRE